MGTENTIDWFYNVLDVFGISADRSYYNTETGRSPYAFVGSERVKQWQETLQILRRLEDLTRAGREVALATVVRIEGSSYRRPGAKLLIDAEGATLGGVSGGCLEADVREVGLGSLRTQCPSLRHYDTGGDENIVWGLGLGCDGAVDVFVQPLTDPDIRSLLVRVKELLTGDDPVALCTVVDGPDLGLCLAVTRHEVMNPSNDNKGGHGDIVRRARACLESGHSQLDDLGAGRLFTEILLPPPRLLVVGAGDDAMPLVRYAADVGFRVTVVDHRTALLDRERFPAAVDLLELRPEDGLDAWRTESQNLAVVMTHSLGMDRAWVELLDETPIRYIGVLGPRVRTEKIVEELGGDGNRVFGPVGLDLGADGPEQVALSIVGELLAVHAGREPRHLRQRESGIHVAG